LAANSIFLTGVGTAASAVVNAGASLIVLGVEYAGKVGRTGGIPLISFGGSLAVVTLGGIRGGVCIHQAHIIAILTNQHK